MPVGTDTVREHHLCNDLCDGQRGEPLLRGCMSECDADGLRTRLPQRRGGANQRAARGAQIIEHDHFPSVHIADHAAARDHTRGTTLLDERELHFPPEALLEPLAKELCTLHATDVGGGDSERFGGADGREVVDEHRNRREMVYRNAKSVVERRRIVDVERDEVRNAGGFEKLCNVAGADGVTQLRTTVLACKCQVRNEGDRSRRANVTQPEKQKQQAYQTLSDRSIRAARQRLQDERGVPAHRDERSQLELAFFEGAFLERGQRHAGFTRDRVRERVSFGQREQDCRRDLVHDSRDYAADHGLQPGDALIVVDVQRDFLPGGALGVAGGDEVIPVLSRCAAECDRRGLPVFATRDWHPPDHCSFRAQGGPWPAHCVAGTPGAELAPGLALPARTHVVSKATTREKDAYSGFQDTDLISWLRELGCRRVLIGGLATDYCVRATALDALRAGFRVVVLQDAVRAVEAQPGDGSRALAELRARGAEVVPLDALLQ